MTDTELRALLEATFPIESHYFVLMWAPNEEYRPPSAEPDDVYVVVRLVHWYLNDDGGMEIRDVKEQAVLLVPARHRQDARLEAWVRGLREAILEVMRSQDPSVDRNDQEALSAENALKNMMPSDLVPSDVLDLSRPQTAEDFTQALLGSQRRLGRLLFSPSAGS